MAHMMYSQHHASMAPPQKPETFMLSSEAQQSLPQDAQVALQQVDNREYSDPLRQLSEPLLMITSEILSHFRTCRLDTRSIHPKISLANWRIRFLRVMVSRWWCKLAEGTVR
jgi:hypothetical protein